MGTLSFVVADSTVPSSSRRGETTLSFSLPFSAGAAALQPGGASASGAPGGLPSASVAERADSFVVKTEPRDYDSDRGENESMLQYTRRCQEQHKKICADGLDADVPKEKFITRLLDGSGLDKDILDEVMKSVTQKDDYEEVANALRTKFSQQECSAVEMEYQRQRCTSHSSSLPRSQGWQEKRFARRNGDVSPEKNSEDVINGDEGVVKIREKGDPLARGTRVDTQRHEEEDLVDMYQKQRHCSTEKGTSEAFVHGMSSLEISVVRDHGADKRPGDHDYGAGARVLHGDATRDPGLHDSGTGELSLETAHVRDSGGAERLSKALLTFDVGEVKKGCWSSSEQEELPYSSEDECWSGSESSCSDMGKEDRVEYTCLMVTTHGGNDGEEEEAADLGVEQRGASADRGARVQRAPEGSARIGPGDEGYN